MRTYSPKKVQVNYGGIILTGYMDGTFIEVDKTSDDFTPHVGADGEGARIQSADESGSVTLTLMQTSASNDALQAARDADKASGQGTRPLMVKDGMGTTIITAQESWIRKTPKVELSNDKGSRVWIFDSTELIVKVGGNF